MNIRGTTVTSGRPDQYDNYILYVLTPTNPLDQQFVELIKKALPVRIHGEMEDEKLYVNDCDCDLGNSVGVAVAFHPQSFD